MSATAVCSLAHMASRCVSLIAPYADGILRYEGMRCLRMHAMHVDDYVHECLSAHVLMLLCVRVLVHVRVWCYVRAFARAVLCDCVHLCMCIRAHELIFLCVYLLDI